MNTVFVGYTGAVIIMFIGILVMYTYVGETRTNQEELKETQKIMNASLNLILEKQAKRVITDNIRFNATLLSLGNTYEELQAMERQAAHDRKANTEGLATLGEIIVNNTKNNLNLTKFNRAAIMNILENVEIIARSLNVTAAMHDFDPQAVR